MEVEEEEAPVPPFWEDERVEFMGGRLQHIMKIKADKWMNYVEDEQNEVMLKDFFDRENQEMLVFSITQNGGLTATQEIGINMKSKAVYIMKKMSTCIGKENFKRDLIFGELSCTSLSQTSALVEEVLVPVLSNKKNHQSWPYVISQDVEHHVEYMKNKMHVVKGLLSGKTLLPVPTVAQNTHPNQNCAGNKQDHRDRTALHTFESMVIKWSYQIRDVVERDSSQPLLQGLNPGPETELNFWKARRENLLCIYEQLQAPAVQKMANILEEKESSYHPTFKNIISEVKHALIEAKDVDLHLKALRQHVKLLEETEFPQTHILMPPLLHTICLIWSHSKFYNIPARIIVLLQEFCNLLMNQAKTYLAPEDLFKEETEEALEHIQIALNVLRSFKHSFLSGRRKLGTYYRDSKEFKSWDFQSEMVFARYDRFLERLMKIEDIFVTMVEFEKLEKLKFGGNKGKALNEQIFYLHEMFIETCKVFKESTQDPTDYANMLLAISGYFLERQVILDIFSPNYSTLLQMYGQELDKCKQLYDEHVKQMQNEVVHKNMPITSGNLKWTKELKDRIQSPWSSFRFIQHPSMEGRDAASVYQKYMEMMTLLDQYEDLAYEKWISEVDEVCEFNLDRPLIKRNPENGLLSVNFDAKLIAVLREVKYLQILSHIDIPKAALAIFEKREILQKYIGSLELIVQWYNKLKQTVLEVEYPLIEDDMKVVNEQLRDAEGIYTWKEENCWDYIVKVKSIVHDLEKRVQQSKNNIVEIQQIMKTWAEQALYSRKDNRKETLINLEDKSDRVNKKCRLIQEDGNKIHSLVEENMKLLKADPFQDPWKMYVEYIDDIVVDGFFNTILHSLDFFMENTDEKLKPSPLFEAQMVLNAAEIVFKPSLQREEGDGWYDLMDELLGDIFKMSGQIKRIAKHFEADNYQNDMDEMIDLSETRQEIMQRVTTVINKAIDYRSTFNSYSNLWTDDRLEFMRQFLLYGHVLTSEEIEAHTDDGVPECPPTAEQFRDQIDIYENLYIQINSSDDCKIFENWFRVDMKPFKTGLLIIIKKWSWMFKEHLLRFVIDSLTDLEEFIKVTDAGLQSKVPEGDYNALVGVMGHLLAVRDRQMETDQLFEPLKQTIALLESYGQKMPDQIYTQLEVLPEKWNNTKKIAISVKHDVAPLQISEVSIIRRRCVAFDTKQMHFRERFCLEAPFSFDAEKPYVCLDKAHQNLEALGREMLNMQESANLFEVAVPDYKQIKKCCQEIQLLKELWDMICNVRSSIADWVKTQWRQINVEQMDVELRRFAKEMWSLDKQARSWNAYVGLDLTLKNLITSLRAVTDLQNPAIRDRHWHQLMSATKRNKGGTQTHRINQLLPADNRTYITRLSLCEKALSEYLETKRLAFPRFYFVSSADLLDILSKGSQPKQVTHHLAKLFDNIADLQFQDNAENEANYLANGMYSNEKEFVPFNANCQCTGQVEHWLKKVEDTMCETIRHHITEAVTAYDEKPRDQWIFDYPAQVALTSSQIWWTIDVGIAFDRLEEGFETALKDYNKKQIAQLNALITMLLGELSVGDRQKIMTICTIDVHARDVVAKLIAQKVSNAQDFDWLSQLRHRWDDKRKHCFANICDAQFQYSYEYLGNTPRLVITPLTDRCYITLTQSLHLTMSGAPAGPAGTGKTETTKDLGRALGVMVYVFNCSEQMDYKSIGNIYKGLAQTGAWGCFDEFNRISVDVLSVVAVQVKSIQDAIRNKKERFLFLGETITLKPSVGIFITMNPGYAGRTELPENLKALFRPCAMVVPDTELICEIMLIAEGFIDARPLARKFISLYTLCKELLSKQDHYDWGLRAVKSVLVVAGSLKRGDSSMPENQVLMRALRDFNLPKIVTDDIPIFLGLISDLFPALDVPRKRDLHFEQMVKQSTLELHLQPEESFILKVVQLEELLAVRHSVFVVGNAGTGKSKVLRTLNKTYKNRNQKPVWNDLNPKAVTTDELFGFIHPATREWKDGLLSSLMREQANLTHECPKWIVLDGDIDPMWIESLNTVMDDNKVLTLASNERIPLASTMRLLFEIHHLKTATPATVSRAGILYINQQDLGWNPYVTSWIETRNNQTEKANLTILFDKYVPPCLDQFRASFLKTITPIPENSMVQTLCSLLDCLLTPENVPPDSSRELYELYFVFACIWAFGGALHKDQLTDYRAEFSRWWIKEMKTGKFPMQGTIFDYYLDNKTRKFMPWAENVPKFEMDSDTPLQAVFVHTSETTCFGYFTDLLIQKNKPVMLVGSAGAGKTVFVNDRLACLSDLYMISKVPFNYYTTSASLQRILEKPLEKKAGRNYGPVGNKKLVYFLDDMNMPEVDKYGTVQPHALIRQHVDYGHWYERQKMTLKEIHNCQYVACMNPTSGSFTINPRLQRHFTVFAVNFPSNDALEAIFSKILGFHFEQHAFNPSILRTGAFMIQAAIWISQKMVQNFLPTAVKFHYIFNLRDISNIFQGILFATPECLKQPNDLVLLWLHESSRVYGDKLVEVKDYDIFKRILQDTARRYFEGIEDQVLLQQPLIFCHFANGVGAPSYMPVKGWDILRKTLVETLDSYNELNAAMNLVLFEDAMQHICRINRILEAPWGYALLIGVGGSGKQSLSKLAAYIGSLEVFQITLKNGYGIQDLKVDLANLYIRTGAKNMPTVFLLTDAQVPDERFLVLINDLLASGDVPDLFSEEDIDGIISGIRNEVRSLGLIDSKDTCWKFFLDRVRLQLKVILCFSPVGSTLRVRARKFPAIVNCTAIDWFHEWPQEALQSVSRRFIQETEGIEPNIKDSISQFMAHVHTSVNEMSTKYHQNEKRYNYTTPKSFLEQITLYKNLLDRKRRELSQRMEHLVNGLQKLKTTASQVEDLKAKLASQEAELQLRNQDAEALITKIGLQTEKVSQEKTIADAEEQKVASIQVEVSVKQKDCEDDLTKAEPALIAATAALNTLNRINLTELKTFPNPTIAVTNVTAAVIVLLAPKGRVPRDRSWKASKGFMGKIDDFLQALINYDKEHIHENCLKVVKEQYLKDPEFNPDLVRTKSFAAAGLCAWVINIVKFYEVYCDVEPKRRALTLANDDLKGATEKLEAIRKKLQDLDNNLKRLTLSFEKATAEKIRCQEEVNRTNTTIELANRLVKGLESENIRWSQSIKIFEAQEKTLCGDVLLTAAFVSYVGSFSRRYRQELMEHVWIPFLKSQKVIIPISEGLDPIAMLSDDATIAAWNNEGLPGDRMSTENATILINCERWPLMIDPQQQGIKWIKIKYGVYLKVVHLGQKGYLRTIETALACGDTVLIENLDEVVDPVLDPLLGRNTIKRGQYIKIGEKEYEYNKNFRLILHTKLANPHYKPEIQAQTTLINFTVTADGLEDQLLADVVSVERPDLENLKSMLTKQQNDFKIELKHLEDELLTRLSAAEGSFLGDMELVEKLESSKSTAAEVERKVVEAKENEVKINEAREHYRPAAARASLLYFVMSDLSKINPMYKFSLKAFNKVFHKAIGRAEQSEDVDERVANLTECITYSAFLYTSQGLFEKDKLTFISQTAFQILLKRKEIDDLELDVLLRFPIEYTYKSPVDFLTGQSWSAIKMIATLDEFRGLDRDVEGSAKRWKKLVESESPENERFPQEWKNKTSLQKLIVLRALRPDRMTYAIRNFVEEKLGSKYVEDARPDLAKSYEETSQATPLFFILSPGVDPLKDVESLGKKLGFTIDSGKFHNVSLGQGQEKVAEEAMEKAAGQGHWVILQNIHLVDKWLVTLEKLLEQYSIGSHRDYRVFISAEPASTPEEHIIPQGILESSIKITNEPPTGMMANLHAALYNFDQDTLEMCAREQEFKSILFSLCYFHACVAGRLKFGPQGWNRSYPFNTGDLTICVNVLYNYLEANTKVPWDDLRYLFGEIMYGGHITDDWDRKLCHTYLEEFMSPAMLEGELALAPGFVAPPNLDYIGYHTYIDEKLPAENPALFGLHPNAEIEFLTVTSDNLFKAILEMQPKNTFIGEGSVVSAEEKVINILYDILEKLPEEFNLSEIMQKTAKRSPYILVCFQECERMNVLMREIRRSLQELDLGLKGELTISSGMEALQLALYYDSVPDTWTKLAYPSTFGLGQWINDLLLRCRELDTWTQDLVLPAVVWLSGFFSPQSFLTAIMQSMARKNEWPLDKMCLTVDVTKKTKDDYGHPPREGAYICGLFMEGARWDIQAGMIADARLKDLTPPMPVIYVRAIPVDKQEIKNVYECPVYKTKKRGPTYVWTFNLKTKEKPAKWVLAGVALLLTV
ncbi:hypothetical protein FKM82_006924 [Ascaphus truei]